LAQAAVWRKLLFGASWCLVQAKHSVPVFVAEVLTDKPSEDTLGKRDL
jgi:hypothetical protein